MISNFSPLLEVFAAIYFTIGFDNIILKRFWNPDFYNIINKTLIDLNTPSIIVDKIRDELSGVAHKEDIQSRRRGRFLLVILICLFVVIAYENTLLKTDNFNISLSISLTIALLVVIFDSFCLKRLRRMLLSIMIVFLSFILVYKYCTDFPDNFCSIIDTIMPLILLITTIGPAAWQLMRNYMYTTVYSSYLKKNLAEEIDHYNTAYEVDKTDGDINKVHKDYRNILYKSAKKHDDTIDDLLSDLLDVLSSKLSIAIKIPSIYKILWYWVTNMSKVSIHEFGEDNINELSDKSIESKYIIKQVVSTEKKSQSKKSQSKKRKSK